MSEQLLDFQSVLSVLRRNRRLLAVLTLLGGALGAAVIYLHPPLYTSSTQVLLPAPPPTSGTATERDSPTDIRVAMSDVVLGPAGARLSPAQTALQVSRHVTVSALTGNVLRISARESSAREAEELSQVVAESEVAYQADAASSLSAAERNALSKRSQALQEQLASITGEIAATRSRMNAEVTGSGVWHADATAMASLTAQQSDLALRIDDLKQQVTASNGSGEASIIERASPAKRGDLLWWNTVGIVLGALAALTASALLMVTLSRRDRRLRTRDEVADALGSAVIGSLRTRAQKAAAGWTALMETYEPTVTDAWSLRQALDHVGFGDLLLHSEQDGISSRDRGVPGRTRTLVLITLSDDSRGLAVGPQLASHAAQLGLRTRLVAGQGHESSAALWAACSALRNDEELRPGLRVDTRRRKGRDDLTIEMVVLDRKNPQFVSLDQHAATVLAVSANSATAQDLARAAVATYEAGGRISGVVVADPDSLDRTTGRLLLRQRAEQVSLPTRVTGLDASSGDRSGRNA